MGGGIVFFSRSDDSPNPIHHCKPDLPEVVIFKAPARDRREDL